MLFILLIIALFAAYIFVREAFAIVCGVAGFLLAIIIILIIKHKT